MEFQIEQYGSRVFVPIELTIPELKNDPFSISFLADTGADITTITPLTATKIDFTNLKKSSTPLNGIGGSQTSVYDVHDALFQLTAMDGRRVALRLNTIRAIKPEYSMHNPIYRLPNLLGTDFLCYFKFTYNSHPKLELKNT